MRREAEGGTPVLIGPAVRPENKCRKPAKISLNETHSLDITAFFG
jgi:hypothetical protein